MSDDGVDYLVLQSVVLDAGGDSSYDVGADGGDGFRALVTCYPVAYCSIPVQTGQYPCSYLGLSESVHPDCSEERRIHLVPGYCSLSQ